jgi:hypothetical protein
MRAGASFLSTFRDFAEHAAASIGHHLTKSAEFWLMFVAIEKNLPFDVQFFFLSVLMHVHTSHHYAFVSRSSSNPIAFVCCIVVLALHSPWHTRCWLMNTLNGRSLRFGFATLLWIQNYPDFMLACFKSRRILLLKRHTSKPW